MIEPDATRVLEHWDDPEWRKAWRGGCLVAGPGRGDCEHFVGVPSVLTRDNTDDYGVPHGWCSPCWQLELTRRHFAREHPS